MKKRPTEQIERWLEVEALCRCAQMEREYGAVFDQHLDELKDDERLIAQMRRLCRKRERFAGLRKGAYWSRRNAQAVIARIGSAFRSKFPRHRAVPKHGSPSEGKGKQDSRQHRHKAMMA